MQKLHHTRAIFPPLKTIPPFLSLKAILLPSSLKVLCAKHTTPHAQNTLESTHTQAPHAHKKTHTTRQPKFTRHTRKVVFTGFIVLLACIFSACSPKIVKEAVYIPTKCDITPPARPQTRPHTQAHKALQEILAYTELLEHDLYFCIGRK